MAPSKDHPASRLLREEGPAEFDLSPDTPPSTLEEYYRDPHTKAAIYRVAKHLCRGRPSSDIDDTIANAWLRAATRFHQFKPGTDFIRWFSSILRTTFIDARRGETGYHVDEYANIETLSTASLQEADAEAQEMMAILETLLDKLSEREQRLFTLHYIENRPLTEVAASEGLTHSNAKVIMHRLRSKLREKLLERGDEGIVEDLAAREAIYKKKKSRGNKNLNESTGATGKQEED